MAEETEKTTLEDTLKALGEVDPDEFAKTLHKVSSNLYQRIFNDGHKAASGKLGKESESLSEKLKTLEEEKSQLLQEMKSLREDKPDLDQLKKQYETALQAKDQEIQKKEKEWSERYSALETSVKDEKLNRLKTEVISSLKDKVIDQEYARIRASDPDLLKRIKFEEAGTAIYQRDGVTPYSIPEGESVAGVIVKEILPTIPKSLLKNAGPTNTGLGSTIGASGVAKGKKSDFSRSDKAAFFEEARKAGKNPSEEWAKLPD